MFKGKTSKKKGLTLLELVIVLGLMGLVTMLVFSFTNTTQKKSKELEIRQELQHEGTMITESFMNNVLQAEKIENIELSGTDTLAIDFIEFKISEDIALKKLQLARYEKSNNELKLSEVIRIQDVDNSKIEKCIVSTYVTKIEILNQEIKDYIARTDSVESVPKEVLENIKNINFKITLEDDYYGKPIYYEHVMELNLRNAK